jgi:hypothetical protein
MAPQADSISSQSVLYKNGYGTKEPRQRQKSV